jgi:hypothetical protein
MTRARSTRGKTTGEIEHIEHIEHIAGVVVNNYWHNDLEKIRKQSEMQLMRK